MRKDKQGMYVKVISESYWEKKELKELIIKKTGFIQSIVHVNLH